ncbi:MAG: cytochrome c-type [Rhodoferax sp.]|nr:cytochrome c-type [Rhodoferax sp.]
MRRSDRGSAALLVGLAFIAIGTGAQAQPNTLFRGIGQPASPEAIAAWNIDVGPDGSGLPKGSGSVTAGQAVYAAQCAACHGARGEGKPADALVGGQGTLRSDKPLKTIGSFWPYATTVYDFIHRAMPYNAPQSLSPDEVYAVTAYILHLNGIVPADAVLDAQSLPKVRMPNRNGFVADQRPDTASTGCVSCR